MEKKVSFLTAAASLVSLMLVISLVISVNSIVSFKFSISGWTKGHSNWSFINSADQIEKLTDLNLHQVLRIQPIFNHSSPNSTAHVRQTIHQILHSRLKVDVWKAHPDHIDALTSDVDQVKKTLRGAFQDVGFYFTIMNHDIKRSIERERRECLSDKEDQLEILSQTPNNFTRFLSFKHIKNRYHRLQAENPDLVSVTVLGYTHEKRELLLVKITGSGGGKETGKKAIYLQAGLQARDWIGIHVLDYIVHEIISSYQTDSQITRILDTSVLYIMPLVNPDGYEYSRSELDRRLWRKNRSLLSSSKFASSAAVGVNLDRNFPAHWGPIDGREGAELINPLSSMFRGETPGSEKEVQAIVHWFQESRPRIVAALDLRSYGPAILRPLSSMQTETPFLSARLLRASQTVSSLIHTLHQKDYDVAQAGAIGGPVYGSWLDFAFNGSTNASSSSAYAFAIELRDGHFTQNSQLQDQDLQLQQPQRQHQQQLSTAKQHREREWGGLVGSCSQIQPTGDEVLKGLLWLLRFTLDSPLKS